VLGQCMPCISLERAHFTLGLSISTSRISCPLSVINSRTSLFSTPGTIYWSSATCGYTERFSNPDPPGLPPFCPNGGTCDGDCPNCECQGGSDIKAGYDDDYDVKGNTCWTNRNPVFYSFYSNLQDGTWASECTNDILYTGPGPYFLYLSVSS